MKMRIAGLMCLAMLFVLCACGASAQAVENTPASSGTAEIIQESQNVENLEEFHVKSADEFIDAIGSNRRIVVEAELLDFSTATEYGKSSGEFFYWQDNYDGPGLYITGVENLEIVGQGKDKTTLQATPRYAEVLFFEDCREVSIRDLTAGHLKEAPGSCLGDVLEFKGCSDCEISGCGLFGCGVNGIAAEKCENFKITEIEVYECSNEGAVLMNCKNFSFTDCSIHDCRLNGIYVNGANSGNEWNGKALEGGDNYV